MINSIIFCYYDWNSYKNPSETNIEWWGIQGGKNINTGGKNFNTIVEKDKCIFGGTLTTN